MSKNRTYKAAAILCIMQCALCIISCSSDDQAYGDNLLPDGTYPLELTATNISLAQSRATVDGSWDGGETVGVMVDGEVYQYTADASGKLTSTAPYYWQNTNDIEVMAWYPYNDGTDPGSSWTVEIDQSGDGYAASDYLKTLSTTISFTGDKNVEFIHQVAKITVKLTLGEGFTDDDQDNAKIYLYDGSRYISTNSGKALIMPTTLQNSTEFIRVIAGGSTFAYSLDAEKTFEKNHSYTYTLKISKTGLEFISSTIEDWNNTDFEGETSILEIINIDPAGSLTEEKLKKAIEASDGNIIITGSISQNDLDVITAQSDSYKSLDMSEASGENLNLESSAFANSPITSISLPAGITTIGSEAFMECTSLQSIVIPSTVTSIGYAAFMRCTSLQSVVIPEGVTTIESGAFAECTSLQSVVIPEGVTTIESSAFERCTSLQSVEIPSTVTNIGENCFINCYELDKVLCKATTPPSLGNDAFMIHRFMLFVPRESRTVYEESEWRSYASRIMPDYLYNYY